MARTKPNNHKPPETWKFFKVAGDKVERKGKICPKCGNAVFMAEHKNRYTCGKCAYTEMKGKSE